MPPKLRVGSRSGAQVVEQAAAAVTELLRKRFDKLARVRTRAALAPLLKEAAEELARRLGQVPAGTFTALQAQQFQLQIRIVVEQLAKGLGATTAELMGNAARESKHAMLSNIRKMQAALGTDPELPVIPLKEIARLAGVGTTEPSLLRHFYDRGNTSARNYGLQLIGDFQKVVATGLATGKNVTQVADDILSANPLGFQSAWWKAERIARTETSWAYNRTSRDSAEDLAGDDGYPDVLLRWTEFVDDDSREPLDERVGEDSLRLHGQLRRPGGIFYDEVNRRDVTEPPNRPNDRATIVVWRASWGEPPGGLAPLDAESKAAFEEALEALEAWKTTASDDDA